MTANLLRRAAAKLRETATAASPGGWQHGGDDEDGSWVLNGLLGTEEYAVAVAPSYSLKPVPDAAYIVLMHPPVALALADLLDATVENLEQFAVLAGGMRDGDLTATDAAAIAVARAVLREEAS